MRPFRVIAGVTISVLCISSLAIAAAPVVPDGLRAYSIIPPGQNGFATLGNVAGGTMQPHADDQREMYASLVDDDDVTEDELLDYFHSEQFGPGATIEREYSPNNASTVYRDGFGIPHVYADTDRDAAFALGYVSAEDRLFQMDVLRHAARGDLASFLGSNYVSYDIGLRREGYTVAEVQAMIDRLDEDYGADGALVQDMVASYTDGVNQRMQEVRDDAALLPVEYYTRGLEIVDWAETDTIYEVILQLRRFGEGGGKELLSGSLLKELQQNLGRRPGKRAWRDLAWRDDPNSYPSIPTTEGSFPSQQFGSVDPDAVAIPDLGSQTSTFDVSSSAAGRLVPASPSSNFIGVAGIKSETGHQLEWGAPQVGYNVPQFFMEIDVHSPTFDVRGPALPGAALAIPLGRGIDHAWSLTTGNSDNVDIRVERLCDPQGGAAELSSTGYMFDGACVEMESRAETIEVKNGDSQTVTMFRTVHGPVFARATVEGTPVALAKQRAFWMHDADSVISFVRAGKKSTDTVEEFSDAMSTANMSFNAVYVDDTSLGYFHVGKYPVRAEGVDPMLPSWGTGEWEWQGFVPFDQLPHVTDPTQGWIVNWNNQPAGDWAGGDSSAWGPTHRVKLLAKEVKRIFRNGGKATLSDVVDAAREVATMDGNAVLLGPRMLQLAGSPSGTARDLVAAVGEWMAQGAHRVDKDRDEVQDFSIPVAAWDTWYANLVHAIFDDELKDAYAYTIPIADDAPANNGSAYYTSLSNHLWNLFGPQKKKMARDYCDNYKTESRETCGQLVRSALRKTVRRLSSTLGNKLSNWEWPADYIEFSEVGGISVDPIPWQNRGTYNHAIEVTGL